MKITITVKDPDGIGDQVDDAVRESMKSYGLSVEEADAVFDVRRDKVSDKLSRYIDCGEYITIEFDTDAGTAVVVPKR